MNNLDDVNGIKRLDTKKVAASIEKLPDLIEQAWKESSQIEFPESYKKVKNVVIDGMGGSGLGPELISHVYKDKLKVPITVMHDYNLPEFVNEDTLVVISSYSGTTEEPLNAGDQALSAGYKITGITVGRKLGEFLKTNNLPGYIFEEINNPSGQPRLGLGYSVGGFLGMFKSLGLLDVNHQEVERVLFCTRELNSRLLPESPTFDNFAKELATKLQGNNVGIMAGEFLSASAHIFANQLNETSKNFSFYFIIPELNHHLLEGFSKPQDLGEHLKIIILESDLYTDKIKKRTNITRNIIEKQKVETVTVKMEGDTPLIQAFEAILVSSWTTFYLGILNGFDPSEVPWVDYFKEQLAKD